ncbi:MAG TPA: hypothetical protein VGL66_08725 [Caulobacteraceae bacterium]
MTRRRKSWLDLSVDAWSLGLEANMVIGLRMMKLAAGGAAAQAEVQRMVSEKTDAGVALMTKGMVGALGLSPQDVVAKSLTHYRRKVRANRRRLSKHKARP